MRPHAWFPVVWAVAAGCRNAAEELPSTTYTTPIGTTTDAAFVPAAFGVSAVTFSVDAAGALTDAIVVLTVATADLDVTCTVEWAVPGPTTLAPWAPPDALISAEVPAGAVPLTSSCDDVDAPEAWGGDVTEVIRRWTWGWAVTPAPSAATIDRLPATARTLFDGHALGGGQHFTGSPDEGWSHDAVVWRLVDKQLLPVDAMLVDGRLSEGEYEYQAQSLRAPALALLDPEPSR